MLRRRSSTAKRSYKRRRLGGSSSTSRRVVGRGREQYALAPKHIPVSYTGGDSIIRRFRRFALDTTLYGVGGAVVQTNQATGLAAPWINLGATTNDLPSAPTVGEFGASCQFALTDVLQFAQLRDLFNEFQINKVELMFSMDNAHAFTQGNGGNPNTIPSVYLRYDPNDSVTPATQDLVASSGDCQYHSLAKPFTYTFYPKTAIQIFQNLVAPGFAHPDKTSSLWLDTSPPSNACPHYGVKMWWRNFQYAAQTGLAVRIQPVFHMTFRRTR